MPSQPLKRSQNLMGRVVQRATRTSDPPGHQPGPWLTDMQMAMILFAVLASVYLLTFSGEFSSIDELAMYASTESLAQVHQLSTPQVAFAAFHNPVGAIEPGQSLVAAPLYLLAQQFVRVNNIHAVLLLNVFVTAATGATLFIVLRRLSYDRAIAILVTLGYGLATMAWPYARSLFREPLVALMWTVATLGLIVWRQTGRRWWLICCLGALGFSLLVKVSALVAMPGFLMAIASSAPRSRRKRAWAILGAVGLLALGGGVWLLIWRLGSLPSLASYTTRYPFRRSAIRIYGLLFSPAKGLLFFSPILLVATLGWPQLWRRDRVIVPLAASVTLGILYLYGNNDMWYGGLAWGPRFLVPLLPLLAIPLAGALTSRRLLVRILALVGLAFSTALQVPVAMGSWGRAVQQLPLPLDPNRAWYDLRLWRSSPALFQAFRWRSEWINLIWWHTMSDGSLARDLKLAAVLGAMLAIALATVGWSLVARAASRRSLVLSAIVAAMLVVMGSGVLLWRGYNLTRDYPGLPITEAREIAEVVSARDGPLPFSLVSISNEFHIYFWLGLLKGRFVHHWCSPGQTTGFEPVPARPLPARDLWLVVDRVHLQPDHSGHDAEYWLNRQAYQTDGRWIGGFEVFRYVLPDGRLATRPVDCTWADQIALRWVGQSADRVFPGDDLLFEFTFERIGEIPDDYSLFVHLFADDGRKILGRDGQPQYGGAPITQWQPGQQIVDRRAIAIPSDATPGEYTIVAGFVKPDGERLPARCGEEGAGDHVELGEVRVRQWAARNPGLTPTETLTAPRVKTRAGLKGSPKMRSRTRLLAGGFHLLSGVLKHLAQAQHNKQFLAEFVSTKSYPDWMAWYYYHSSLGVSF